jgi:ribosomal-protein-alanine N-acetyltransferase
MKERGIMVFETERLYVRKLKLTDIEPFNEMQRNPNVMRYITGTPKSEIDNMKELEGIISKYQYLSNDFCVMAIIKKNNNQFVGTCAVIKNEDEEYEIGYRFIERFWGNGYGKEILEKLIEYCFVSMNLDKIVAYVYKENFASVRILDNSVMEFINEFNNKDLGNVEKVYKLNKDEYLKDI